MKLKSDIVSTSEEYNMSNMKILVNQIECVKCGDKPYSAHRHAFRACRCGAVSVDGGMEYLRRVGDPNDYVDLSIVISEDVFQSCIKALIWCDELGRNNLDRLCAVFRALRDEGFRLEEVKE